MTEIVKDVPKDSPLYDAMLDQPTVETVVEPVIEPIIPEGGVKEPIIPVVEPKPYEFAYKPAWDKLEKDGIKIPDDFKQGKFGEGVDEWSALHDLIIENTEFEPEQPTDDPFLQNYLQVPPEHRDEYIEQYKNAQEFFKLSADDGLKAFYQIQMVMKDGKEERKYDDDTITKHLEGMSPILKEQEWERTKSFAQKQFDEVYKKGSEQRTQEQSARIENINKTNLETAKHFASEIDKMTDFGGVPLTDDIKKEAKRNYILLTQIDPTTGRPHLLNLLNDNSKLRGFVLANTILGKDVVRDYISSQNEKYAKLILDEKLDIEPKAKTGTVGAPAGAFLPEP